VMMNRFRSKFKAKFHQDVQVYAPNVYDAVKLMAMAMKNAGSSDPINYLPALKKIKYKGITGVIDFDYKGDLNNGPISIFSYVRNNRSLIGVFR
jgi:branched-chain amino acid transport system substrate-binding protein